MDFLAPPMFDNSNIDVWKFKMSSNLKVLGLHIYLATTKKSHLSNDKYLEANAQALDALMHTLSKEQFSMISHCDSAFAVWNILTSPKEQMTYALKKKPMGDESDKALIWSKGLTPLRYTQILI